MILVDGKLNYAAPQYEDEYYLFTGNSYINKKGELVMGRGAAAEVKSLYPTLPLEFGKAIGKQLHLAAYGLRWVGRIGVFQVKRHFRDYAEYPLIGMSAELLAEWAFSFPAATFHMNFPGIGYGGLDQQKVLPMLEPLPLNVYIYKE